MTINEAKDFLKKMASNWQMSAAEKQAFLDWQRQATPDELQSLDRWHRQFLSRHIHTLDMDGQLRQQYKKDLEVALRALEKKELSLTDKAPSSDDRVAEQIIKQNDQPSRKFKIYVQSVVRLAAIIILIIGCIYVLKMVVPKEQVSFVRSKTDPKIADSLPPGSNRAILTLANGTQIYLDSMNHKVLQFQNGNSAKNLNGNLLSYSQFAAVNQVKQIEQNKLSTPRGGQYQIQLPDGTHVWLNSASELVYPTAFTGNTREVQLTGEAYFEVAHRANQPFIVHTRQMEVKVLGTGFNIMAYPEEKAVRTTLVHGSVQVQHQSHIKRIMPGEQATLFNNQQDFNIATVNIHQTISWKEGEFWFKNTSVKNIMRQLSRWYDFDVVYKGDISKIRLSGVLAKQHNARQLLAILQSTRQVKFDVQGKTIVVQPITD